MASSSPAPAHARCLRRPQLRSTEKLTTEHRRLPFSAMADPLPSPVLVGGSNRDGTTKYERFPATYWDRFYCRHRDKFFKDRHYLEKDWGQYFSLSGENLVNGLRPPKRKVVLEVGCGTGNTVFPLLAAFPDIFVHACDFSPRAISLLEVNESFKRELVNSFVCDVTIDDLCKKIPPSSVDVVTLIFMLSAVSPIKMPVIFENIRGVLKPSGYVLLRDYATGDFAQDKLASKNQKISENFYVRGDGTCAFYFTEEFLSDLFTESGFSTIEVSVYGRQIENRNRKLTMERRWIRGIFRAISDSSSCANPPQMSSPEVTQGFC